MGYEHIISGINVDTWIDALNLVIAVITNVCCVYVVIIMFYWWWRLRVSDTNLRPLILGIAFAKFAVWYWSFTGIIQIIYLDITLPAVTLPARIFMMMAAAMHVYVTTRIKPAPSTESIPGPFERS